MSPTTLFIALHQPIEDMISRSTTRRPAKFLIGKEVLLDTKRNAYDQAVNLVAYFKYYPLKRNIKMHSAAYVITLNVSKG